MARAFIFDDTSYLRALSIVALQKMDGKSVTVKEQQYISLKKYYYALMLAGGLIVVTLLLIPYASNGFWFDDVSNSQIYFALQRLHVGLGEFSYRVVKAWISGSGRLMLGFFYGYPLFYFFHDLIALRLAHCISILINIALYGYMLALLGATIPFLVVWAIFLVGLFQINGIGLDPIAGFAFHYQALGIQLTIVLILFVKWLQNNNSKYLFLSLMFWLLFMTVYEVNFIFIPIAFALIYINGDQHKKLPGVLLVVFTSLYLALYIYIKSLAAGSYSGSDFGLPSKMALAYLKQLTASLPGISYWAITQNNVPFVSLIRSTIGSILAWATFISSFLVLVAFTSIRSTKRVLRSDAFIISLGLLLLPAIFPAISLRYQNEVAWGAGTLPVYYQNFGLAFFIALAMSYIPSQGKIRFIVPALISLYLAFNLTINSSMVESIDKGMREPRDAFAIQAQSGLFNNVQDGDIIQVKNVAHYINANLIFEWTGKRVYVPTDDHSWYPEKPGNHASTFRLSRSATTEHNYQLFSSLEEKSPNEFDLYAIGQELLHVGYKSGDLGNGIELSTINFETDVCIEVLLIPGDTQKQYADILSNHFLDFRGLAIELVDTQKNLYGVAFGNGKGWMDVGKFTLSPNQRSYISLQVKDGVASLYVNGDVITHNLLPEPIAQSSGSLFIGNWKGDNRQFQGRIEEVLISSGSKSEKEVISDFKRLAKAGKFSLKLPNTPLN